MRFKNDRQRKAVMAKLTLMRVPYGKRGVPKDKREYRLEGKGPVGTLAEWKAEFPNARFEVIDPVEPRRRGRLMDPGITLQQLGGNRFIAMTGAKQFVWDDDRMIFRIPKAKDGINKVVITLNAKDLYDVDYYRIRGVKATKVRSSKDLYDDMLQSDFTENTGLYTRL